jgi:hypothetical protein
MGTFEYGRLSSELGPDMIRILELDPTSSTLPIRCTIKHVYLSQKPVHAALSYNWGSSLEKFPILLNEKEFHVTKNLHDFLKQHLETDRLRAL